MAALDVTLVSAINSATSSTYAIAKVAVTPKTALVLTFSLFSFSSSTLAFFAGCAGSSASISEGSGSWALRFFAILGELSRVFASSTIFLAVSSIFSVSSGRGSSGDPAGISTVTFVCVVSVVPSTSTDWSTSTLTVSSVGLDASPGAPGEPALGSVSATDAASSKADCRVALAALACAMLASFWAFVCRFLGEALVFFEGVAATVAFVGDDDLVDLDRGVLVGACNFVLSPGKSNFGGGAIGFLELEGACVISVGSSNARIQSVRPYSEASPSAALSRQPRSSRGQIVASYQIEAPPKRYQRSHPGLWSRAPSDSHVLPSLPRG